MGIIPDFLIKRIYKKGSLRKTAEGIAFDLKNILGPGMINGVNFVKINDEIYNSEVIKIITSGISTLADQVTPDNPISFRLNQEGTLILQGAKDLKEGINKIIVDLMNPEVGQVQVTMTDNYASI